MYSFHTVEYTYACILFLCALFSVCGIGYTYAQLTQGKKKGGSK